MPERIRHSWDHEEALRLARLSTENFPTRTKRRARTILPPVGFLALLAAGYLIPSLITGGTPF